MIKLIQNLAISSRTLISLILFSTVLAITIYTINTFQNSNHFPIHYVKVYGIRNVDRQDVVHLVKPLANRGFFAIDVQDIKDRLLQLPWVSQTAVQRVWPNQLIINISEKKPLASWNGDSLLSLSGELFQPPPATIPANLPQLKGPEGVQIQVMQYYTQINQILMPLHTKISILELTPDMQWNLSLDNGIKMTIGYKDILTRLQHFVKVYPKIIGNRIQQVDSIDLRYSNGMAVRWKTV